MQAFRTILWTIEYIIKYSHWSRWVNDIFLENVLNILPYQVFEELEEEEAVLEREFEQFRKKTDVVMTPNVVEPDFSDLPKAGLGELLWSQTLVISLKLG